MESVDSGGAAGIEGRGAATAGAGSASRAERVPAWREAFLLGLVVATVFVPFDFLYPERLHLTVALRALLMGVLVACHWRLGARGVLRPERVVVVGAVTAALVTPALVAVSGGATAPRFGFLLLVPFLILTLLPDFPWVALLAGVASALSGGAVLRADHRPWAQVGEWTILVTVVIATAAIGARRVQALSARTREAEAARHVALSDLEASERRLAASERLALVGRLAAGIGHEINNPLAAVKANLSFALEELERRGASPALAEPIGDALAAADRIGWVAADLRSLTASAAAPLVPCDAGAAIQDAVRLAGERLRGARIVTSAEPGLPAVHAEPRFLADAVAQLASRAAAAAPRGGAPATIRISARRTGDEVEIAVDDDGPPIPAHLLPKVFEPFASQAELRGAGLGLTLPITREIAERGGGRVAAARRDAGNRFTVTLAIASGRPSGSA